MIPVATGRIRLTALRNKHMVLKSSIMCVNFFTFIYSDVDWLFSDNLGFKKSD
jgi:hypothetical protein